MRNNNSRSKENRSAVSTATAPGTSGQMDPAKYPKRTHFPFDPQRDKGLLGDEDVEVEVEVCGGLTGDASTEVLLVKRGYCFTAKVSESTHRFVAVRQVSVTEALEWYANVLRRAHTTHGTIRRLCILAARMLRSLEALTA